MKIYAIIVTYNGSKWINKCFGSLINSSIPLNILAIDNASTDGTPSIIKEKYPQVEVVETGENLGFGKANNIGLKRVLEEKANYAFLLNQDAWIKENTIKDLIRVQTICNYGILAPLQLNASGEQIDKAFQEYSINNCRDLVTDALTQNLKSHYKLNFVNAACWLLPLNTILNVGGFDPIFTHYGEDKDYCNRALKHNIKIGICPQSKIHHDREYRSEAFSLAKHSNKKFVITLAVFKNSSVNITRIKYRFYQINSFLLFVFSKNKKYYKSEIIGINLFLKIYNKAVSHKKKELTIGTHYLK